MPGTELASTGLTPERRAALVRNLTLAGWLLLGGSFGFIAFQLERVRDVGEQRFASIWDQRIEVLSFIMLPPNLVVLAPPVFVAAAVTWLAGTERDPWLSTLLRLCAGLAIVYAVIGIVSISSIMVSNEPGPGDFGSVMIRLGGVTLAAGLAVICRTADRATA
ncbi:MAG TPA: hypothetical protein VLN74_10680 [Ilumatobacteraceae bacterium]|nr:hypothetical protein [Ilumatobacteraceae bacterium]